MLQHVTEFPYVGGQTRLGSSSSWFLLQAELSKPFLEAGRKGARILAAVPAGCRTRGIAIFFFMLSGFSTIGTFYFFIDRKANLCFFKQAISKPTWLPPAFLVASAHSRHQLLITLEERIHRAWTPSQACLC